MRRRLRSAVLFAVWPLGALALVLIDGCLGSVHADAPGVAAGTGLDPMAVLVLIAVITGGLGTILGAVSTVLHAIAGRTKTTVDDRWAAGIDTLRADVAQLATILKVLMPSAPVNVNVQPAAAPPPPTPIATALPGPGQSATMLAVLFAVGALLVGGLALPACAGPTRSDTLHAALVVHDTTEAAFLTYDHDHQLALAAAATSHAQGEAALKAYQAKAAKVEVALDVALRAIAALGDVNDQPHIDGVKAAIAQLSAAYAELKEGPK